MYELDFLSRQWVPDGWSWNSYEGRAEPINGARVDLTSTAVNKHQAAPPSTPRASDLAQGKFTQAGAPIGERDAS